jgi:uncharacterized protein (DUF362 family)
MPIENILGAIDRRAFMRIVSITGVGGLVFPRRLLSGFDPLDPTKVVIVEDPGATSGLTIDGDIVQSMMDCAIRRLTNTSDVGEAWKSIFPGISETSVVSIKVNCLNHSLPTHPETATAVAEGLKQMTFDGTPFPENNIVIFDRWDSDLSSTGYTLNSSASGVRCFGTQTGPGYSGAEGYSTEDYDVCGQTKKITTIVTEVADYIVNVSVLKNHTIAGVTLCLKNHYGSCNNPDAVFNNIHGNHCDPCIPELNALPPIRDKQVVNICDALFGIATGGPTGPPQFSENKLIMSKDPVAVDYWGREILDGRGSNTIALSHHIETAAGDPYNLGTNDPAQMDVVTVTNPAGIDGDAAEPNRFVLKQNHPNPFSGRTTIRFHASRPEHVTLTVFDSTGRRIRNLVDRRMGAGWHEIPWNGLNDAGRRAADGVYFCQLKADGFEKAVLMQLVR